MGYKFEKLDVWRLAIGYTDKVYEIANLLPESESFNLRSQLTRAVNSIALNIAEGSTSQTDKEQGRFIGLPIRSLIETVACFHLIHRRKYLSDPKSLRDAYTESEQLFKRLQAFCHHLKQSGRLQEQQLAYELNNENPFA